MQLELLVRGKLCAHAGCAGSRVEQGRHLDRSRPPGCRTVQGAGCANVVVSTLSSSAYALE